MCHLLWSLHAVESWVRDRGLTESCQFILYALLLLSSKSANVRFGTDYILNIINLTAERRTEYQQSTVEYSYMFTFQMPLNPFARHKDAMTMRAAAKVRSISSTV
jgi:hypothetical protein